MVSCWPELKIIDSRARRNAPFDAFEDGGHVLRRLEHRPIPEQGLAVRIGPGYEKRSISLSSGRSCRHS